MSGRRAQFHTTIVRPKVGEAYAIKHGIENQVRVVVTDQTGTTTRADVESLNETTVVVKVYHQMVAAMVEIQEVLDGDE